MIKLEVQTKRILLIGLLLATLVPQLIYALSSEWFVTHYGQIEGVGVELFSDAQLTTELTTILWNTLREGDTATYNAWLYNAGNVPITCAMETNTFAPVGVDAVLNISWNYDGSILDALTSKYVIISLSVAEDASTYRGSSFSFMMKISATPV